MAVQTGMSRATVHRYALALRQAGLMRVGTDGAYALGPRFIQLAAAALTGLEVAKAAGPYLEQLSARAGHTAVLSVWDGGAPVVVRVVEAKQRPVHVTVATGTRLPPRSAQGVIFRAFRTQSRREPHLADVRRNGFACDASVVPGVVALACPVFQGAEIAATLALVGTQELQAKAVVAAALRLLRDAAAALSGDLGHVPEKGGSLEGC